VVAKSLGSATSWSGVTSTSSRRGAINSVYTTCPTSARIPASELMRRVSEVAEWTERCGLKGTLIYTGNERIDPWLISQAVISSTKSIVPLVAVQPVHMHPLATARMIASLSHMYSRQMHLNLISGGSPAQLAAIGDLVSHDDRYARLEEFGSIISRLLRVESPLTYAGDYYQLIDAVCNPRIPKDLLPVLFVSGSSRASFSAALELRAIRLFYPKEPGAYVVTHVPVMETGIRIGVIARETAAEAWKEAYRRFPSQVENSAQVSRSDSKWYAEISKVDARVTNGSAYWLRPFLEYKTYCPYLVGSYAEIAECFSKYVSVGVSTLVLDIPQKESDLVHVKIALQRI